jgi:hypothetical protein
MAHKEKYTKGAARGLTKHYERHQGRDVEYKNQSIDPSRTHLNYNLGPERDIGQMAYIAQRVGEVSHINRKDVNVMVDWIVTMPKTLGEDQSAEFFRESYAFLRERYGGEANVVSAWVHMDEVTPHMHFAFVPVVADRKNGGWKLCAKEAVDRRDLRTFHEDLQRHLERELGRTVDVLNGATRDGNRAVEELKRGAAIGQLERIRAESAKALERLQELRAEIGRIEAVRSRVAAILPQRTVTGAVRGVTVEQVEQLKAIAINYARLEAEHERLSARYDEVKRQVPSLAQRVKSARDMAELERLRDAIGRSGVLREALDRELESGRGHFRTGREPDRGHER